jgi:hypothetical protein
MSTSLARRYTNPTKAPVREKADADGDFPYVSIDGNMSPATQARLKELLASRAPANYPIEAHYNSEDAKTLHRRKVESSGHGQYSKNRYLISRARLPRLLIAMIRSGKEDEYSLASGILSTLQIELV